MKKIFITGGAGFIGSALIQQLEKKAYEIFVMDNLSFGNRSFINVPEARFFKADIREPNVITGILKSVQPDTVIHLAAIHFIPYCNQHPFEASDINIRGTMNILDAVKKIDSVKKLFFASTAAVYPIADTAVRETHELLPLDIYGLSKHTGERLCNEFHKETGIPTIICRFFNAFGPNETNPHLIPEIQAQINNGIRKIRLGNLTPKRDFIHTYDMALAIEMLLEKFEHGIDVFNLGRGIEYAVTEVVEAFEKHLEEKVEIEIDPQKVRKVERMHLLADITKIKDFTGWVPRITLEEGIKTLISQKPTING
ncbi:MAG: NAD(P)-dependent oxidoreductase [Chitinophagaceae bacterium]|nr:NAD(P)-dependent oxidoreductase [Chitinophagaceae bacterium]